jgi:hypothetical protein
MQYTWNEQKNLKCDVHMYQKKTKCKIYVFMTTFFGGCNVFSPQWQSLSHDFLKYIYYKLFPILRPFGTKKSIRQNVDHGGQIVF